MSIERRLSELGISLPEASGPAAHYANAIRTDNLLFLSGKGPFAEGGVMPKGKLGREYSVQEGYRFARSAGLNLLATLHNELGSLNRIARFVEVQGFVNAAEDFEDHALVLDGCSDLLIEVFGEKGRHARSVLGVASLRGGLPIVVRAVAEVAPG